MRNQCSSERAIPLGFLILLGYALVFHGNASSQWTRTDGPYGGQVQCFAEIGASVFAGTDRGGVFLSTDNGANWHPRAAGLTNRYIFSLAARGVELYAGTKGNGVFRSTDSGVNWQAVNTGISTRFVRCLLAGEYGVFAGTDSGGVFRSTDYGQTWIALPTGVTAHVRGLVTVGGYLFAGTDGPGIFRSTDNGTTWTLMNNGLTKRSVLSLSVIGGTLVAGTYSGGVFVSTDYGSNWTQMISGMTNIDVISTAASGANLYAGTYEGGVFRSTDGGSHWVPASAGLRNMTIGALYLSASQLYAGTDGSGVFISTNDASSWSSSINGMAANSIQALEAHGAYLFAGTYNNGAFSSNDSGSTWSPVGSGLPDLNVRALAANGTALFAGTFSRGVFRSSDNGSSWAEVNTGLASYPDIPSLLCSGTSIYAGTEGGGVFRSTNNGTNWVAVNSGIETTVAQAFASSGSNLFVGTRGDGVYRSPDNGSNWLGVSTGLANRIVRTLAATPDGSIVLAGTEGGGVFVTTNNGSSWTASNSGMTDLDVRAILVNGSTVFAGTDTSGVFVSTNNGASWTHIVSESSLNGVYSLLLNGSYLFVGGDAAGIWRRPLTDFGIAPPTAMTTNATGVTSSSATLAGTVNPNGRATSYHFEYGLTTSYGIVTPTESAGSGTSSQQVAAPVTGLSANTTYHYRLVASNAVGTALGSDQMLTTAAVPPIVTTTGPTNVTTTGGTLTGTINASGTSTIYFFEYGQTTSYGAVTATQSAGSGTNALAVSAPLTGLTASTTYHYRLVANNSGGTTQGADQTLTTGAAAPIVTTTGSTNLTTTTATLTGIVNPNGVVTGYYFEYGLTTSYGLATAAQDAGTGSSTVTVSASVTGLSPNTTYHYRLVASSAGGTTQGDDATLTTAAVLPTVTTTGPTYVTTTGGTLTGLVNPNGTTTDFFFEYGQTTEYGSITPTRNAGSGNGTVVVSEPLTGLSSNATYHYRLVATNAGGSLHGSDQTLTTGAPPPAATTTAATNVSSSGATLTGMVNPNGIAATCYFEYGTTTSYGSRTSDLDVGSDANEAPVSTPVTGLSPNTSYHYRLVASSAGGTTQGDDQTLTTGADRPTVVTLGPTNVTTTGGTLTGTVNPNGATTSYYFEYGLTTTYGTVTPTQSAGFGSTAVIVSAPLSGLPPNTTYHYRLVASSTGGSTLGEDQILTTGAVRPTATTGGATTVTSSDATLTGAVNPNGITTSYYFEYGVTTSYGSVTATASAGSGSAEISVSAPVTGLVAATTYHYRLVATSAGGTSQGSDQTLTTGSIPPAVTTTSASDLTSTSATLNGTVNPNGVATSCHFEYGPTTSYGMTTPAQSAGSGMIDVSVNASLSGLSYNAVYHYRLVATNAAGTTQGSDQTLQTLPRPYPTTFSLSGTKPYDTRASLTAYQSEEYRLIGLPGNSGELLGTLLGGQHRTQWQVYWDNGGVSQHRTDYYVEYDGSSKFACGAGKAFWLLYLGPWTLSSHMVPSASLSVSRDVAITLTPGIGWNLITNPFDKTIPWSAITSLNGISDTLRSWTSTGWVDASSLEPYEGYLFFNRTGVTSLRIPYDAIIPKAADIDIEGDWAVKVIARSGKYLDQTTSFGIKKDANLALDRFEQRKPRHFEHVADVYFDHPDWDSGFNEFATDFRPDVGNIQVWDLTLRSDERKVVNLEFTGASAIPDLYSIRLLDPNAGRWVDLRTSTTYSVTPLTREIPLKVLVGREAEVAQLSASIVPTAYALEQNYPNPFNPKTVVSYQLPVTSGVRLVVYDMLGREVSVLLDEVKAAGKYQMEFDGTGLASGVYLCRMSTGTFVQCRKMVLVR